MPKPTHGLRRSRRSWPTCPSSGKVRLGEHKDVRLVLAHIARTRSHHALDGVVSPRKECRAYRCSDCRGWHLTSMPVWPLAS